MENPATVMVRISGFGQTGPYSAKPGFGVLGEAMGGLRHLSGEPGRTPVRVGISIGDTLAALHGVIGVLLALQARSQSISAEAPKGRGQVVDVAVSRATLIGIALNTGNGTNMQRLVDGGIAVGLQRFRLGPQNVQQLLSELRSDELSFVQGMWDTVN